MDRRRGIEAAARQEDARATAVDGVDLDEFVRRRGANRRRVAQGLPRLTDEEWRALEAARRREGA